jgi:glycosyltransferase involved in cell wall biosynthesis
MTGISIAIATHNRAGELALTLASLGRIDRAPGINAEILVIANGCTDKSEAVAADATRSSLIPLRCIPEYRLGLSHARNRAIDEAKYDVIAFLDDDVDVDANWLSAMAAAFSEGGYAAVGGRAHLVYPNQKPQWLDPRDEGFLTKVEHGDEPRAAGADELYGVNLAISRDWMNKVGRFRTDLGRIGASLIGDEEAELLMRIVAAGGKLFYEPRAVVGHRVPFSRLQRKWFWRRCFHGNRSFAKAMPECDAHSSELFHTTIRAAKAGAGAMKNLGAPQSAEFFHQTVLFTGNLGRSVGLLNRLLGRTIEPDPPAESVVYASQNSLSHTSV